MAFNQAHALVVGVGSHQYAPFADVPVTVTDAKVVAETLQDNKTCGYPAEQVTLLHDAKATKQNILSSLEQIAQNTSLEDTVFFFFCGHGALGSDGEYYLVCHDAKIQNNRVVPGTGISQVELLGHFRDIQAKKVMMVFNACFSGNLSPTLALENKDNVESSSLPEDTSTALLGTGEGRIVITASRESQKSYIGSGKNTIFTQALVDGLKGKAGRSGGFISAYGLYEYIFETVTETVKDQFDIDQEPELTVLKGVGPFAVALYKGATTLGDFDASQPVPDLAGVREVKPSTVQKVMARVEGSGTIVQGNNNQVVGAGGVSVGGNVGGSINTGTQTNINTEGGAYIGGGVKIKRGDFVGRDKIIKGKPDQGEE